MATSFESMYAALAAAPRLLVEVDLVPAYGTRFQPTGFPDLGAAYYKLPDGTPMVLVESAQSTANRLENVCWDAAEDAFVPALRGLPYVAVDLGGGLTTNSVLEAHRLNSPYIANDAGVKDGIKAEVGDPESGPIDNRKLARAVFRRDVGTVLHGVFLEKVAGRLRLQRLLSGVIEARNVVPVTSGGVKLDRVDPTGSAKEGYGNVPFSRVEYAAEKITGYFSLDLATLRGYGLGEPAERLLIALSLYKILRLLDSGLRLRTACDLEATSVSVRRPNGLEVEDRAALLADVEDALPSLIAACDFGSDPVTRIASTPPPRKAKPGKDKSKGKADDAPVTEGAEAEE